MCQQKFNTLTWLCGVAVLSTGNIYKYLWLGQYFNIECEIKEFVYLIIIIKIYTNLFIIVHCPCDQHDVVLTCC